MNDYKYGGINSDPISIEGDVGRKTDLHLIEVTKPEGKNDFGFNIVGGVDRSPWIPGHCGIFVSLIKRDGLMDRDGRLKVGDRILSINGIELSDLTHSEAVSVLREAKGPCKILIEPNAESKFILEGDVPASTESQKNLNLSLSKLNDDRIYGRQVIDVSFPSSTASTKSGQYSQDFTITSTTIASDDTTLFEERPIVSSSSVNDNISNAATDQRQLHQKRLDDQTFIDRHILLVEVCAAALGAAVIGTLAYIGYSRFVKH